MEGKRTKSGLAGGPIDNGRRPSRGVGVCSCKQDDGTVVIVFDDMRGVQERSPRLWEHHSFYTSLQVELNRFKSMDLTDRQFAQIGRILLARLVAHAEDC
jgi:hypothetical protein